MLDVASSRADARPDVSRPFPSRLISRSADGHPADGHQLEAAAGEFTNFIRILESLENDFDRHRWRGHVMASESGADALRQALETGKEPSTSASTSRDSRMVANSPLRPASSTLCTSSAE